MVALYVALIINGRRTFQQVPEKFKAAVHEDLAALGLDDNGNQHFSAIWDDADKDFQQEVDPVYHCAQRPEWKRTGSDGKGLHQGADDYHYCRSFRTEACKDFRQEIAKSRDGSL